MKGQKEEQLSDEDQEPDIKSEGIEAILCSNIFSNRTSMLYLTNYKTYFDVNLQPKIINILENRNENTVYSINVSQLWKLLINKIKLLNSNTKLFSHGSDKRAAFYCFKYASVMALNDAKEKVIAEKDQDLRANLRQYIKKIKTKELSRKQLMKRELEQAHQFEKAVGGQTNAGKQQFVQFKSDLIEFELKKESNKFILKVLSFIQRLLRVNQEKTVRESKMGFIVREIYGILTLCHYLAIYLTYSDWVNVLLKNKRGENLYFYKIAERKGFGIIHRFLDDAPNQILASEIKKLQVIYQSQ